MEFVECTAKLVTVVAGIKKLQIMMTIVDDLVSIDNLIEDHLTSEPNNEYIQSCDIVAFNKICKHSDHLTSPYLLSLRSVFNFSFYLLFVLFFGLCSLLFDYVHG